jgi:hypothetical protein
MLLNLPHVSAQIKAIVKDLIETPGLTAVIDYRVYVPTDYSLVDSVDLTDGKISVSDIRCLRTSTKVDVSLGPLFQGIQTYKARPSASIAASQPVYIIIFEDLPVPDGLELSVKDEIIDGNTMLKVASIEPIHGIAYVVTCEGSTAAV